MVQKCYNSNESRVSLRKVRMQRALNLVAAWLGKSTEEGLMSGQWGAI